MELIPILSTIILVATISTFILAIGAYILYKVREAKGQQVATPRPREVQAELITPAAAPSPHSQERFTGIPSAMYAEQPIFVQPKTTPQQPMQPGFTPGPQQYRESSYAKMREYRGRGAARSPEKGRLSKETKFLKYTSEGYIDAKTDKSTGALKWR